MSEINDKVVVITGASSGIGEASARLLAQNGARLMLGARRVERLTQIASEICSQGGTVEWQMTDVTEKASVSALVAVAQEKYGRVDVMINNAGVMPLAPLQEIRVEEWENAIDVNIKGVLYGIAAALPVMRSQGSGHFINVASIAAHMVVPSASVYCATKFAVWAISEGLRQEVGSNIRTTIISPGLVDTELPDSIIHQSTAEAFKEVYKNVAMQPKEIANAIAYAVACPANVDVNEIILRPKNSPF